MSGAFQTVVSTTAARFELGISCREDAAEVNCCQYAVPKLCALTLEIQKLLKIPVTQRPVRRKSERTVYTFLQLL